MNNPLFFVNADGVRTAAVYSGQVAPALTGAPGASGNGSDVQLAVGQGRLVAVIPHGNNLLALSGVAVNFYDSPAAVSGGPLAASGHIPLATLFGPSNLSGDLVRGGQPIPLGVPFNSGLCFNSRSGQPGLTVIWQPEAALARSGF